MDLQSLIAQLRQRAQSQPNPVSPQGMPQGGGTIGQQPTSFNNMQQPQQFQSPNTMAALLRGGTAFNNASNAKAAAGALGTGAAAAGGATGAGFGLGQPLVTGGMGSAGYAAPAAAGGLVGMAPMAAMMAKPAGQVVGDVGDSLGLKKTGIPSQIRAFGDFTSGDFGGAWDNLKDSVKNIFSIF